MSEKGRFPNQESKNQLLTLKSNPLHKGKKIFINHPNPHHHVYFLHKCELPLLRVLP